MTDLRCTCGAKLAEYDDYTICIKERKCKTVTVLAVVNGKLTVLPPLAKDLEEFKHNLLAFGAAAIHISKE